MLVSYGCHLKTKCKSSGLIILIILSLKMLCEEDCGYQDIKLSRETSSLDVRIRPISLMGGKGDDVKHPWAMLSLIRS